MKSYAFKINLEKFELHTISSPNQELFNFLMLHHNLIVALRSIFFNCISHHDTRIKVSKESDFNEACKWLLTTFCFWKSPFSNCNTWGNDKYFMPIFHEVWPIGILLIDTRTKFPCLIQWFVFTIMPQSFYKLKQLGSTCITFSCHKSKCYDQSLQPLLWHSYMNFSITWIILWTKQFQCVENK